MTEMKRRSLLEGLKPAARDNEFLARTRLRLSPNAMGSPPNEARKGLRPQPARHDVKEKSSAGPNSSMSGSTLAQ